MKHLITIAIAALLSSCITTKKAQRHLEKTGELAAICAMKFPVLDSVGDSKITYAPANNIDYSAKIDSLESMIRYLDELMQYKTAQLPDSGECCYEARAYLPIINALRQELARMKANYKPCKPDTVFKDKTVYQRDRAYESVIQNELNKETAKRMSCETALTKAKWWRKAALITWALLIFSGLVFFAFAYLNARKIKLP